MKRLFLLAYAMLAMGGSVSVRADDVVIIEETTVEITVEETTVTVSE